MPEREASGDVTPTPLVACTPRNDGPLRLRHVTQRAEKGVYLVLLLEDLIAEQEAALQAARVLLEPFEGIVTVL